MDDSNVFFRNIYCIILCYYFILGEPFDEKGYGIGVPLGASYRDDITMAILHLNERGVIQNLEKK